MKLSFSGMGQGEAPTGVSERVHVPIQPVALTARVVLLQASIYYNLITVAEMMEIATFPYIKRSLQGHFSHFRQTSPLSGGDIMNKRMTTRTLKRRTKSGPNNRLYQKTLQQLVDGTATSAKIVS